MHRIRTQDLQGITSLLTVLQELGMSAKLIDTNFLKDPNVLETQQFKAINPAGKCACLLHAMSSCTPNAAKWSC
jgi:hypothetical protein